MKILKDLKKDKKEAEQKIRDILADFCSKNDCEVGDIKVQSIIFQ